MADSRHNLDQSLAGVRELLPRTYWAIYQGCLEVGFDEGEAFSILQTWILSQNPNGIRPDAKSGPKSDLD